MSITTSRVIKEKIGSGTTLIKSLENRGILSKETTRKITSQ